MPHTETLLEFAQQIAPWLGQRWVAASTSDYGRHVTLNNPYGESVTLRGDGYDWEESKRVIVTGSYPMYNRRPVLNTRDLPKITAAIDRGAEAVAKDIQRRFLPQYRQLVGEAVLARNQYTLRNANMKALAQRFAEAVGGEVVGGTGYDLIERYSIRFGRSGDCWGKAEVTGDDFHIEARHVPADLAVKIGALIREASEED